MLAEGGMNKENKSLPHGELFGGCGKKLRCMLKKGENKMNKLRELHQKQALLSRGLFYLLFFFS